MTDQLVEQVTVTEYVPVCPLGDDEQMGSPLGSEAVLRPENQRLRHGQFGPDSAP
ncbi:MAG: hypothetical protein JNK02_09980 [Planctomycetes bacterium]|nr:hypothetical protein [Planctomycetota bacterium]